MSTSEFSRCFPALAAETPLGVERAAALERLFKVLANDLRLRILHALLSAEELCVSDICEEVGMRPPAVSNHLQRLQDQGVVKARRAGQHVYYRVVDPCVAGLMDLAVCLLSENNLLDEPGGERRSG